MKKIQMLLMALLVGAQMPAFSQMTMLTDDEKQDVIYMLEEEKMARDVYIALGEKWNSQVFQNINASEERHYSSMLQMAKKYDLDIPLSVANDVKGKFENRNLQKLYDELIATGNTSLTSALIVGAKIEEIDIDDLNKAIANTNNSEIVALYTPLLQASENHLRSFTKNLGKQGVDYKPVVLKKKQFKAIVEGSTNKGACCEGEKAKACCSEGNGMGKGKGKGMKKNKGQGMDGQGGNAMNVQKGKSCCKSGS